MVIVTRKHPFSLVFDSDVNWKRDYSTAQGFAGSSFSRRACPPRWAPKKRGAAGKPAG